MDNKKLLVVALIGGLFLIGCGCAGKGKQEKTAKQGVATVETTTTSTRGGKTYVSKYGFSMSHPNAWKLEEDTYALARGIEQGKVPVWIYEKSGEGYNIVYITSFGYSKEITDFMLSNSNYEVKVNNLVNKVEIFDEIGRKANKVNKLNVAGNEFYVFSGNSIQDKKEIDFALFYLPKTKTIVVIEYFSDKMHGNNGIINILNRIKIMK